MFPIDSTSVRQLHHARIIEARQARTQHEVLRPEAATRLPEHPLRAFRRALSTKWHGWRHPAAGPLPASHELFVGLDQADLERLGSYLTVLDVPAGRSLGRQGAPARQFVTVLRGQVGVSIDGVPNSVLDDGSHFGAVALLDNESNAHRASFSTMERTRIAVASPGEFHAMLNEFPTVADRIHAMTKIRRAYLAGLAEARTDDRAAAELLATVEFPAHIFT